MKMYAWLALLALACGGVSTNVKPLAVVAPSNDLESWTRHAALVAAERWGGSEESLKGWTITWVAGAPQPGVGATRTSTRRPCKSTWTKGFRHSFMKSGTSSSGTRSTKILAGLRHSSNPSGKRSGRCREEEGVDPLLLNQKSTCLRDKV